MSDFLVECHQVAGTSSHESLAACNGSSSIIFQTAARCLLGGLILVLPDQLARGSVQREHVAVSRRNVNDAIDRDWRCFQAIGVIARLEGPDRHHLLYIRIADLIQGAKAPGQLCASMRWPIGAGCALLYLGCAATLFPCRGSGCASVWLLGLDERRNRGQQQ